VLLGLWLPLGAAGQDASLRPETGLLLDRWAVLDDTRSSVGLVRFYRSADLLPEPPEEDAARSDVRFQASVTEKDREPAGSGLRLLDLRAHASSPLWGGSLLGETRVLGYGAADGPLPAEPDRHPRAVQMHAKGSWAWLESGVDLQSVTPGLEKVTGPAIKPDREGGEVWVAVGHGQFRLRATVAAVSDNLLGDPSRPRTTKTDARLALELKLPSGSLASLTASQGTSVPSPPPRAWGEHRGLEALDFESLALTLYRYGGPQWDLTLTTTYTESEGRRQPDRETVSVVHDLSGSYRPIPSVCITPALSFSQDDPTGSAGNRYLSTSVAVAVAIPRSPLDLTLYGSYTRGYTTDQLWDDRTLDALATLTWRLRRSSPTVSLALEGGSSRHVDAVGGAGDYDELRGLMLLRIAGF
jgi:hypothetical protein